MSTHVQNAGSISPELALKLALFIAASKGSYPLPCKKEPTFWESLDRSVSRTIDHFAPIVKEISFPLLCIGIGYGLRGLLSPALQIVQEECHRPHVDDFPRWPTSNGYHLSHVPDDVVSTLLH